MSLAKKAQENLQKKNESTHNGFSQAREHLKFQEEMVEACFKDNDPYHIDLPHQEPVYGNHQTDVLYKKLTGLHPNPLYRWLDDPVAEFNRNILFFAFVAAVGIFIVLVSLFSPGG